jgi:hypothetical protein
MPAATVVEPELTGGREKLVTGASARPIYRGWLAIQNLLHGRCAWCLATFTTLRLNDFADCLVAMGFLDAQQGR